MLKGLLDGVTTRACFKEVWGLMQLPKPLNQPTFSLPNDSGLRIQTNKKKRNCDFDLILMILRFL